MKKKQIDNIWTLSLVFAVLQTCCAIWQTSELGFDGVINFIQPLLLVSITAALIKFQRIGWVFSWLGLFILSCLVSVFSKETTVGMIGVVILFLIAGVPVGYFFLRWTKSIWISKERECLEELRMSESNFVISKSQNKTRKHWLLSTFSLLILYPLVLFAFFAVLSESVAIPKDALIESLIHAFAGIIPMWIIWHCAYRKYGTKFLTFWLVTSPIKALASIVEFLKESYDSWTIAYILLDLAFFSWWFIISLKMRTVNKTIQKRLSLKNVEPKQV